MNVVRQFLLAALFLIISVGAAAHTITGIVRDADTREPVPYCAIRLLAHGAQRPTATAMTDTAGVFTLPQTANGRYTLQASYVGYTDTQRSVTLPEAAADTVTIFMRPDAMMLDQVVVTGTKSELKRRHSSTLVNVVSARTFDLVSAASLAVGLNFQPGVRVENDCQNCGFT